MNKKPYSAIAIVFLTAASSGFAAPLVDNKFTTAADYTDNFRDTLQGARINHNAGGGGFLTLGNDSTTQSATVYDSTPGTLARTLFTLEVGRTFTLSLNTQINGSGRAVTLGMLNSNSTTTKKGVAVSLFQNTTTQWLFGHRDLTSEVDAFPGGANTSGTRTGFNTQVVFKITNNGLTGTISASLFNLTNLNDTTPGTTILQGGTTFANRTVTWADYGFNPATQGMEIFMSARGATGVDNLLLIPEPSSALLLGLTALGAMTFRRRRTA